MNFEKIKINKTSFFIFLLSFIIFLSYLIIYKFSPDNKDLKNLNDICKVIEKSNYNLKDAIKDNTIDISCANNILCDNLVILNSSLDDLNRLSLESSTNDDLKNQLTDTLKSNIKLFELAKEILSNDSSKDISKIFNEYKLELDALKEKYESLKNSKLKITFPTKATDFFDCVTNYANTLIKISRDTDISFEQKRLFCLTLKKTIDSLDCISDNLEPIITDIYANNRSLDSLASDIQNKKSTLNTIKNESFKLSIPEDCTKYYEKLQETINSYDSYISSLSSAFLIHKASVNKFDMSDINSNYKDALSKYNDYKNVFAEFKEDINSIT